MRGSWFGGSYVLDALKPRCARGGRRSRGPWLEALETRTHFSGGAAPVPLDDVPFDGPIVITRGGVYRGNWQSLEHGVPAVSIQTTEPVIIRGSILRGRDDLIDTAVRGVNLTVFNTRGYGMNPEVRGEATGRFLAAQRFANIEVRRCSLHGTAGIRLYKFEGDPAAGDTIRIVANRAVNIDGRKSDGDGGYLKYNIRRRLSDGLVQRGFKRVQFLQLDQVEQVPGVRIAWNKITNAPRRSRVEENISIYKSSGTEESPIVIRKNFIRGGYTVKPWKTDWQSDKYQHLWKYSGGGILIGNGAGSAHVVAARNQVISTTNYGIAIYGGHDLRFHHNRIVSSGVLPSGRAIAAQNVGVYIWNPKEDPPDRFFNNRAHDNRIGWANAGSRNDWWIPDATSFDNNQPWPDPITPQTEADELPIWRNKLKRFDMKVGAIK